MHDRFTSFINFWSSERNTENTMSVLFLRKFPPDNFPPIKLTTGKFPLLPEFSHLEYSTHSINFLVHLTLFPLMGGKFTCQNDDALNEWQRQRWKQKCWNSSRSNWTIYRKWIVYAQDQSHAICKTSWSELMQKGEVYIFGSSFINCGVLHDNYQPF